EVDLEHRRDLPKHAVDELEAPGIDGVPPRPGATPTATDLAERPLAADGRVRAFRLRGRRLVALAGDRPRLRVIVQPPPAKHDIRLIFEAHPLARRGQVALKDRAQARVHPDQAVPWRFDIEDRVVGDGLVE